MSNFEYFGTIATFVAGFVLLIYLFRMRALLIRKIKLQLLQAKAKLHYITRPLHEETTVWGNEGTRKRDIR